MKDYETERARYEAQRNAAADRYFEARPQLPRSVNDERIFESGFCAGWSAGFVVGEQERGNGVEVERLRAALQYVIEDDLGGIPRASSSCRIVVSKALYRDVTK